MTNAEQSVVQKAVEKLISETTNSKSINVVEIAYVIGLLEALLESEPKD